MTAIKPGTIMNGNLKSVENTKFTQVRSWAGLAGLALTLLLPFRASAVGTWLKLDNQAFDSVGLLLLLSDGTIMAQNNPTSIFGAVGSDWYCLTPDPDGHYLDGTWSRRASMNYTRLFYSSQVLRDGRVFVAGGEHGTGGSTAEVFDPVANQWTVINPPIALMNPALPSPVLASGNQAFVDSISMVISGGANNGDVLIAPVGPNTFGGTLIYNPDSNIWTNGPTLYGVAYQDEASWVKLADGSILTIDPFGTNSERYIPSLGQWVPDAKVPVPMYDVGQEMGAGFLLPDGRAFFLGATGYTALYTPSPLGGTNLGHWAPGPAIPTDGQGNQLAAQDAPAAMMPNGKILCSFGHLETASGGSPSPTYFFEYDYTAGPVGSFTQVASPTGGLTDDVGSYQSRMLVLPDGGVLYCHYETGNVDYSSFGSQLYIYAPDNSPPVASGKPVINSVTRNADNSYHLTGTGLNGISAGAAFGDDAQMDSDYPLVLLANLSDGTGHANYARTFNWSSTGVMTGNTIVSTEFDLPTGLLPDAYALTAIANGIHSDPVTFLAPAWVDFNFNGSPQNGSFANPFQTLAQGVSAVPTGGNVFIKSAGSSSETMTISKPMTIEAIGGPATIGN